MADIPDRSDKRPSSNEKTVRQADAGRRQKDVGTHQNGAADWVSEKLKELYGEVAREPVPDSILELLRQIEEKEGGGFSG